MTEPTYVIIYTTVYHQWHVLFVTKQINMIILSYYWHYHVVLTSESLSSTLQFTTASLVISSLSIVIPYKNSYDEMYTYPIQYTNTNVWMKVVATSIGARLPRCQFLTGNWCESSGLILCSNLGIEEIFTSLHFNLPHKYVSHTDIFTSCR